MSDIWSGVSVGIAPSEGEWLYRVGAEVRGPVPFESVVSKLLGGELTPKTQVAREGGEWHPIAQVAAFEPHVRIYTEKQTKKSSTVFKRVALLLGILVVIAAGIAGYWLFIENEHEKVLADVARLRSEADLERQRVAFENTKQMSLVALVSLDEKSIVVKNKDTGKSKSGGSKRPGTKGLTGTGTGAPGDQGMGEDEVMSCKLSEGDIFGTLKKQLAKINVCVEDEKTRDAANLPPTLELEFVVKPTGSVTDFHINDRHYRTGPMNNCMIKAFNTIHFPESTGTNCPVTIPIKIGS